MDGRVGREHSEMMATAPPANEPPAYVALRPALPCADLT
jgi:hypothetical protein